MCETCEELRLNFKALLLMLSDHAVDSRKSGEVFSEGGSNGQLSFSRLQNI